MKFGAAILTMLGVIVWVIGVDLLGFEAWGTPGKMICSCGFLATAILSGAFQHRYGAIIFAGLVFSWFGDLFLTFEGGFLLGLLSFLAGHVAYAIAFSVTRFDGKRSAATATLLALPVLGILAWLWPHLGNMRVPVVVYTLVISAMVALAAGLLKGPGGRLAFAGAVAFYLSDIYVARGAFVTSDLWNRFVGAPLYWGGQLLLALSIAYVASSNEPEAPLENRT